MTFKLATILLSFSFCFASFSGTKKATFAGGCFWCIESAYDGKPGVISAISGYSGDSKANANYKAVSSGKTKHLETVQVSYDDSKTSYKKMLEIYWRSVNPQDGEGQFADRGYQYQTAILYHDKKQKELAEESIKILEKDKVFRRKIVVPIIKFTNFFPAEDYHQDYHKKKPKHYKAYFHGSGRGPFLEFIWEKKKGYKIFK